MSAIVEENSKKRVLVVMRWPVGGIRTYVLYNYPFLLQAGYRFTFVGPREDSFDQFRIDLQEWPETEFVSVPTRGLKCNFYPKVRSLIRQRRFCMAHSHGVTAATHVQLANIGLRLPHVFTPHEIIRPDIQFPGFAGRVKLWILGRILSRANVAITVGQDAGENFLRYFPQLTHGRCRTVSITNGIDTTKFRRKISEDPKCLRRRLGLDDGVQLFGFVGRVEATKGFLLLVEALDRIISSKAYRPFHLVIIGREECPGRYLPELTTRPQLANFLTFVGHMADIAPTLFELDLLVTPSLFEACPLLPMEAMCAGLPVLGSDCTGLREVLRDTPSVMVRTGDANSLEQGIREFMLAPWDVQARDYAPVACERFDVKKSADQLRKIFDDVTTSD